MTTAILTAQDIFADARLLHSDALERLAAGDLRDAAEKAWGATRRATEALLLARTGERYVNPSVISRELRILGRNDAAVRPLVDRYGATARFLHGDCFYAGLCDPADETAGRIQAVADYIAAAETLAAG